jgi:F-type H+-transporting ATPase subunit delta
MQDSKLGGRVAQRYAEALFDLGKQENTLERFDADMALAEAVLTQEPDFQALLASPVVATQVKKDLLVRAFTSSLHPNSVRFFQLMVDRRRAMFLLTVCTTFRRLVRKQQKVALAEVVSAVALTPEQEAQLKTRLIDLTGSNRVELLCRIDPTLLGGMVVKFGDQVIDVSLRGQLRRLALQLR